jgi:hypothetical protein
MRFTMRIGKTLRLAALTFALAIAVTPALVDYADAGRGGGRGGGGMRGHGGGGGHGMRGGGGGRHYGGGGKARHYGGGGRHYGGGKHYSGKHYSGKNYGHRIYRRGYGYGYWRGGIWITSGVVGYGAGSYCSRLYYYNYNRWLYECR